MRTRIALAALAAALLGGCFSDAPRGLAESKPAKTTVKVDLFHRPLPEMPLPNDLATRHDPSAATGRRINASMIAPTAMERRVRRLIDQLDGWGTLQPIVIPFTGPLDVASILAGHRDPDYAPENDVVYLLNVDRRSKNFGKLHHLDVGNGNYPVVVEDQYKYWKNDPRGGINSILYEEISEDRNGNGVLDLGGDLDGDGEIGPDEEPEDTDADGLLDEPNYLPGANPAWTDLAGRSDALMTFYEKQTNTLIVRPMEPLDERTVYAVVVTRRLLDADREPVGSPFAFVNHTSQTDALAALPEVLPSYVSLDEVAFAFSFTTQTEQSAFVAVRDGLYGHGVQKHLATEFKAEILGLEQMRDDMKFRTMTNPYLLYSEQWLSPFKRIVSELVGTDPNTEAYRLLADGLQYVDYIVVGSFQSPQLFQREDALGNWLPLDEQSWPADLDRKPARARAETVYFTLLVPRKEISARGEGKPAPIALVGHGYGSSRFEGVQMGPYFARHGFATLMIDGPSHGLGISETERELALGLVSGDGIAPALDAMFKDRALNQDHSPNGSVDSGADFWTAYLFHTRDIVRQYALDWMQAIRIVRSFDGSRRWDFDLNEDGEKELAGDFDADGVVDIGKESMMVMVGGSLGGIISSIVGSLDPEVSAIAPISGGGGFGDMGIRTVQGGALEGFILRSMAPLYAGTLDDSGELLLETIVPALNRTATVTIARGVTGIRKWDTLVVENLTNGSRGCGFVNREGRVRAAVESDAGDRTRITFYEGPALDGGTSCGLRPGARVRRVIDTFEVPGFFQWNKNGEPRAWEAGAPLVALADGLGLRRGHPDLRRFQGLGQLVLDPADPGTYARHLTREPLTYPGTGQSTGAHAVVVTTLGDLAVPASSGVTYGRAAGIINYLEDDPRYGKPVNQVLLDRYVAEAVHTYARFTMPDGTPTHEDVENFSGGWDIWEGKVPRLDPPLRIGFGKKDSLGGVSAAIFPFPQPEGQHGFAFPGEERDRARKEASCPEECNPTLPSTHACSCSFAMFDTGTFLFNMLGSYLASGGKELTADLCHSRNDCPNLKPVPPLRSGAAIDAP